MHKSPPKLKVQTVYENIQVTEVSKESESTISDKESSSSEINISQDVANTQAYRVKSEVQEKKKLVKGNLPPADILFDHLARVSNNMSKVVKKNSPEETALSGSFAATKGSFQKRDHSVLKDAAKRIVTKAKTFATDLDSDEYDESFDE